MIAISDLKKEYYLYRRIFLELQRDIYFYLKNLKSLKDIDIHEIKQRPNNSIKKWTSIKDNIARISFYGRNKNNIFDIKDLAGVRITCHCQSDLTQLNLVLPQEFKKTTYSFETKPRLDSNTPYKALHYIITKKMLIDSIERNIACEIQARTILGDAWAIQSHKYIYKDNTPASSKTISYSLSAINEGLEGLWDLIKSDTIKNRKLNKYDK